MRRESATHSPSGIRTTRLPRMPITSDCVSAAPDSSVSIAAWPITVPRLRSKALGDPPRCMWPSTVTRTASPSQTLKRLAQALGGDRRRPADPSRPRPRSTIESRRPASRPALSVAIRSASQSSPRRALGDEQRVGAGGDRAHQREVAAVPAHHLDDEGALVARGRAADGVNRLGDAVERRVGADGHVGAGGVVVDRADQADHRQPRMARGRRRVDLAPGHQFRDESPATRREARPPR